MNSMTLAILVEARREDLLLEAERERLAAKLMTRLGPRIRQAVERLGQVAAGRTLEWQHLSH
jgi:hypothetical protein